MIIHKGQIIQQRVRESGKSVTHVADEAGITRANMYDVFKREQVDPYLTLRIGKAIDYDFGKDFKDLQELANQHSDIYENTHVVISNLRKDLDAFKQLYHQTLEENKLLLAGNLYEYFKKYGPIKA